MGGTVSGLAAKVTWGLVDGMGGTVSGLAIAEVATAAIAATRTVPRTLREVDLIIFTPCGETTAHTKSNPKGSFMHHKSNIAGKYF